MFIVLFLRKLCVLVQFFQLLTKANATSELRGPVAAQVTMLLSDVTKASGWVLNVSGPQGVRHTQNTRAYTHSHCSVALRGETERQQWRYIMANVLRQCVASAGRWCVAQHSRANGQIGWGGGVWRNMDEDCSHPSGGREAGSEGGGKP